MEDIRMAAMAYYANMSSAQKQSIQQQYKSLDTDGDGKVSTNEFLNFVKGTYPNLLATPLNMFKLLDKNNDGTLDFEECFSFFYMFISNRFVICDVCRSYLWSIYFLCVECYNASNASNRTFDLCCSCYRTNNFNHAHSYFLDNYALLRKKPWKDENSGLVGSRKEQVSSTREEKIKEVVAEVAAEVAEEVAEEVGFQIVSIGIQTAAAAGCTIM